MTHETLEAALDAAHRFLLEAVRVQVLSDRDDFPHGYPKQTGAMRRASMDLTRALADLRRPR